MGNTNLSHTGNGFPEFNDFEFGKAELIAIFVNLTMDSDNISYYRFLVLLYCELQINVVTSGF